MRFRIPAGYKPLLIAAAVIGLAYAAYFAVDAFSEPAAACCAPEA